MFSNTSNQSCKFRFTFTKVEDVPIMSSPESLILVTLSTTFLLIGIPLNIRILTLLSVRKKELIIDRLMVSNAAVSIIGHSLVLAYYIASNLVYPMSDYIGVLGCLVSIHFTDTFIRFYNFCFPVAIASRLYLLVVQNAWVRTHGMSKVANAIIACSIFIPILMTLSVSFPISEHVHFGFNR